MSLVGMLPEAMLMSMSHAATEGNVWVHGSTAARDHVDICGPRCHQTVCRCPWCVLQPEAMWMTLGHTATGAILTQEWPAISPEAMVMSGSMWLPRTMSGFMVLLESRSVLMFMSCITMECHVDVCDL